MSFSGYIVLYLYLWLLSLQNGFLFNFLFIKIPENDLALTDFPRLTLLIRPVELAFLYLLDTPAYDISSYCVLGCRGGFLRERTKKRIQKATVHHQGIPWGPLTFSSAM